MAEPTSDHLRVRCGCSAKLKVPRAAMGRRIKCPKCGSAMEINEQAIVTDRALRPAAPPPPPPPADDDGGLMEDLLALESTAVAKVVESASVTGVCPRCHAQLADGARVCVACGTDVATGKTLQGATVKPAKGSAPRSMALATGRFAMGTAFSSAGALIGAAIWFAIAYYAGFEIGWIAWGVGVLAGLGMRKGYGEQNARASLVAVIITVSAIMVAKLTLYHSGIGQFEQALDPERQRIAYLQDEQCNLGYYASGAPPWLMEENPNRDCMGEREALLEMNDAAFAARKAEVEEWRERRWEAKVYARVWLAYDQAWNAYDDEAYGVADATNDQEREGQEFDEAAELARWEKHLAESYLKVDALTEEIRLNRARNAAEAEEQQIVESIEEFRELTGLGKGFFSTMFSPFDALFIFLAVGSALKLAGGEGA